MKNDPPKKPGFAGAYYIGKEPIKPLSMEDLSSLPESYYVGQEYVEDPNKFPCHLEFATYSPGVIKDFEFFLNNKKVRVSQGGTFILARIENIEMSQKLFDNVKAGGSGTKFILAELTQFLPKINEELMKQKYLSGHLLTKMFSTFDINHIFLRKLTGAVIRIDWPQTLPGFPPSQQLAKDEIFIRDLLSAINHYFDKNFDDCIRNLVTSAENFFRVRGLKGRRRLIFFKNNGFVSIVKTNLAGSHIGQEVIRENMIFVYKVRNKIVHHDFRIRNSNGWGAKKGIGTVLYLYQMLGGGRQLVQYMHSLSCQFLLLMNFCGDDGNTLDRMKKMSEAPRDPKRIVNTPQDLDHFVFEGLRFSPKEKVAFLHGKG